MRLNHKLLPKEPFKHGSVQNMEWCGDNELSKVQMRKVGVNIWHATIPYGLQLLLGTEGHMVGT